ncbi:hypothetical protein TNCV_628501 [Trichonephila clavipes]|nr:hypothetical protein TNCV_628501 [Trichonephila clavipes]
MTRRVENREGSLGYPGVVTPAFTKDSKPLGKRKRLLGYLGIVKPVLTQRRVAHRFHIQCDGMGCNRIRRTFTPTVDPLHHENPEKRSRILQRHVLLFMERRLRTF